MLAVPKEERGPLREWSLAILGALEPAPSDDALDWGNRSVAEFSAYLAGHIARYRKGALSGGDVLGLLLAEETDEGERLSEIELIQNCIFLLNAGHETTTNLIGNGIAALLDWPDQLHRLRANPCLIETAVEEFLRFESSNQLGNRRVIERIEIGGVTMEPGVLVTLGIGAANRDPAQFADPDRLDIARTPNKHLAFGGGIHACAGMSLARIEGRIAISRLIERAPIFMKSGTPQRGGRARFRGFMSYPVAFG
jgi:cytochrome P450